MEIIITTLLSSVITALVTHFLIIGYQNRKAKIDLIKLIAGKSYMITEQYSKNMPKGMILNELTEALNQIWIVFNKSKLVLEKRKLISNKEVSPELILDLLVAMCNDAKFKINKVDVSIITKPIIIHKN